jgi:tetratricopeptide (TPR) repeat protein
MKIKQKENDAILLAESKDYECALSTLTVIIEEYPYYGSAYNNRAQVYRIMGNENSALVDIEKAIEYGDGSVLKQAYTQRAIIKKKVGDEQGAELDFQKGAQYGNKVAKSAVKNNPFAKMCNEMVNQIINK